MVMWFTFTIGCTPKRKFWPSSGDALAGCWGAVSYRHTCWLQQPVTAQAGANPEVPHG